MKINKKHKAYAVILGVAFSALGVNFTFGGPSTADAMPAVAEVAQTTTTSGIAATVDARHPSIAAQLRALAAGENTDLDSTMNPFAPSAAWITSKPVAAIAQQPATDFQASHHLSAIMRGAKGGQVLINGHLVRLGEMLDGYRLVAISKSSIRLSNAGGTVNLRLNTQSAVQSASN